MRSYRAVHAQRWTPIPAPSPKVGMGFWNIGRITARNAVTWYPTTFGSHCAKSSAARATGKAFKELRLHVLLFLPDGSPINLHFILPCSGVVVRLVTPLRRVIDLVVRRQVFSSIFIVLGSRRLASAHGCQDAVSDPSPPTTGRFLWENHPSVVGARFCPVPTEEELEPVSFAEVASRGIPLLLAQCVTHTHGTRLLSSGIGGDKPSVCPNRPACTCAFGDFGVGLPQIYAGHPMSLLSLFPSSSSSAILMACNLGQPVDVSLREFRVDLNRSGGEYSLVLTGIPGEGGSKRQDPRSRSEALLAWKGPSTVYASNGSSAWTRTVRVDRNVGTLPLIVSCLRSIACHAAVPAGNW